MLLAITLIKTNSGNTYFRELVPELDKELAIRDGDEHAFYAQYNKIDKIKYVVVALNEDGTPVGCGAIKEYSHDTMEVKRMYVPVGERGKGIASKILSMLEDWSRELNFSKCILETGKKQHEAIELYKKCGYSIISNFGQYEHADNSICFEKIL